jgi:tetratricopeptide (TPR) repeat protein
MHGVSVEDPLWRECRIKPLLFYQNRGGTMTFRKLLLKGLLVGVWPSMLVLGQVDTALVARANRIYQEQKWNQAEPLYARLARDNSAVGVFWYRYGYCLRMQRKYQAALPLFEKAHSINPLPIIKFNIACSYAGLGRDDDALKWLGDAVGQGFAAVKMIEDDVDLKDLRSNPVYAEAIARAKSNAVPPCERLPEYRQFDFWLGEWDVRNPAGMQVGENRIEPIESGCVIAENYSSQGYSGKSFSVYNASIRKWQQFWVDNQGGVLELAGQYMDGAMRLAGISKNPDGSSVYNKVTWFPLDDGRVRQLWQSSKDNMNWNVVFDGYYSRKKNGRMGK